MDLLTRQVERFAAEHRIFRRIQSVLIGVSGGTDSVAALVLLLRLRETLGLEVQVAHFNHMIRDDSGADLEFVRDLCAKLGVPCFTGEGDVRRAAEESRSGIEDAARTMRYQFLAFVAQQKRAGAVVTGHTRDDQVETVLHRIVRGSGIRGLRGMQPRSSLPGAEALYLLRPLLCLGREDTGQLCEEAGIQPRHDASNEDLAFTRNTLRLQTLPALADLNPSVDEALLGLAESATELFAAVERQAMECQPIRRDRYGSVFSRHVLAGLPSEGLTLVIEREALVTKSEVEVNRTRLRNLREAIDNHSGSVGFGAVEVEVSGQLARIGIPVEAPEPFEPALASIPGVTRAGPWRVSITAEAPANAPSTPVELAGLRGALRVRRPVPGDVVHLRGGTKKLADALAEGGVPAWERDSMAVVADSEAVRACPIELPFAEVDPEDAFWINFTRD